MALTDDASTENTKFPRSAYDFRKHLIDMMKEPSREDMDFVNAQVYHKQLLKEILTLFQIYCGMCGEHAKDTEPAFARAIFFTLFGAIEASVRVLAATTLLADTWGKAGDDDSPSPVESLTAPEKQFLRQEVEDLCTSNWTSRSRTRFVSLLDALHGYPTIYARLFGVEVCLDKSSPEWQKTIELKRLRDIGAHGNTKELGLSPESMCVSYKDIQRLLEARRWYCTQLSHLPSVAGEEARQEVAFVDRLLHAGFSEQCRRERGRRFANR